MIEKEGFSGMAGGPEGEKLDEMAARIRKAGGPVPLDTGKEAEEEQAQAARASRPAMDFVSAVCACIGIGWFIDYKFDTAPWCVVGGLFIGFAVGLLNLWRTMSKTGGNE